MLRDALVRAGSVVAGTAIAFGTLAPAASAAPIATPAPSASAVSAPGGVVEVDGHFTPQQQAALKAVLSSPSGRAQIEKALGTVSTSKPGTASTQVQGGKDGDHWWIKISMGEIMGVGVSTACKLAFPEIGWFVCPPLGAAVNQAVSQVPNAGGVWAELYTDGRVRAGTW
ncbi:hypothetical protein AB0J55_00555 [Amycolatopsis sp. NPDC049688]|uniref:hypothetical protein n=1 Tax=Amycolatopsis sp. NPDC049688 TaxID=3154733 RepID=UPI0034370FE4